MLEKVDRILLITEAVLIALPISILALLAALLYVRGPLLRSSQLVANIGVGLTILVSLLALFSGWRLFVVFLLRGVERFRQQTWGWWAILMAGVFILVGSLVANLLPRSATPSATEDFIVFVLAVPILVPLCHLTLERLLRKR